MKLVKLPINMVIRKQKRGEGQLNDLTFSCIFPLSLSSEAKDLLVSRATKSLFHFLFSSFPE